MKIVKEVIIVVFCLLLIPAAAFLTTAAKQRLADGPSLVFSGGPLEAGALHAGAEPDWSVVSAVPTIELQLLDPPRSRRIWIQAARDGRAVIRIDGVRYERQLIRIQSGDVLDGITAAITSKYPSQTTRAAVEAGDAWLFEAAPRK